VDVAEKHATELDALADDERPARLCELNVVEQVVNVCQTTVVEDAWARGHDLTVHGVVYGLQDGLLRDLDVSRSSRRIDGR
jgi:carbonic anhydrase